MFQVVRRGQVFGLLGLTLKAIPGHYFAEASMPSTIVLELRRDHLDSSLKESPRASSRFHRAVCRELAKDRISCLKDAFPGTWSQHHLHEETAFPLSRQQKPTADIRRSITNSNWSMPSPRSSDKIVLPRSSFEQPSPRDCETRNNLGSGDVGISSIDESVPWIAPERSATPSPRLQGDPSASVSSEPILFSRRLTRSELVKSEVVISAANLKFEDSELEILKTDEKEYGCNGFLDVAEIAEYDGPKKTNMIREDGKMNVNTSEGKSLNVDGESSGLVKTVVGAEDLRCTSEIELLEKTNDTQSTPAALVQRSNCETISACESIPCSASTNHASCQRVGDEQPLRVQADNTYRHDDFSTQSAQSPELNRGPSGDVNGILPYWGSGRTQDQETLESRSGPGDLVWIVDDVWT